MSSFYPAYHLGNPTPETVRQYLTAMQAGYAGRVWLEFPTEQEAA